MEIKNKEFLAKGKRGFTYTAEVHGEKVLIKEHNPDSEIDTISNEAAMNKKLNGIDVGPKFIAFENNQLIREFVEGERIEDFFEQCTSDEAKYVLKNVLEQCQRMDELGVNKFEMTHPYKHILVRRQKTVDGKTAPETEQHSTQDSDSSSPLAVTMIDFERCKNTEKPKNVTQFCQYIGRIQPLLEKTGLLVSEEEIRELGKAYKQQGYDMKVFEKLVNIFS